MYILNISDTTVRINIDIIQKTNNNKLQEYRISNIYGYLN